MKVLGIDPSTHTGVAVVGSGKTIHFTDEIEFKKDTGFERASKIVGRVLSVYEAQKPDLVVLEDMFIGHASSALTVVQIGTMIRYFLWQEGIQYLDVSAASLKKFVTGKGNSKKEEVMMYVLKHWGFASPTNNIADAVGLAMFGLCALEDGFQKAQDEVVKKVISLAKPEVKSVITALSS